MLTFAYWCKTQRTADSDRNSVVFQVFIHNSKYWTNTNVNPLVLLKETSLVDFPTSAS